MSCHKPRWMDFSTKRLKWYDSWKNEYSINLRLNTYINEL
jgi:hypothetical protein